ncbi:MAG TPA: GT-D fold domain-containing glycosyltransferase, partial [Polyangiaceae bacterium]|nr:GT-D fold domain-containing glycosyltransferase [Polyangiaceae bacterium]
MTLPIVLSEQKTLAACSQFSLARFGDGELRLATGGDCSSQRGHPALARELAGILARYQTGLVVGIPNFAHGPRTKNWAPYASGKFANLYHQPLYGSSFVSRPDNAPSIDTPEYWAQVRALWAGKDITLMGGDDKSLTAEMMPEARSVRVVRGPSQHAYAQIDPLEEQIGRPSGTVILCLGATATCLAARLHAKHVHALDLGHIGMFMRHAGAYRFGADDLVSPAYREQLQRKHQGMRWGKSGASHAS